MENRIYIKILITCLLMMFMLMMFSIKEISDKKRMNNEISKLETEIEVLEDYINELIIEKEKLLDTLTYLQSENDNK